MSDSNHPHTSAKSAAGAATVEFGGSELALLNTIESEALIEPDRLADPVRWKDPGPATDTARRIGVRDGQVPGFDGFTHLGVGLATTPNQEAVRSAVELPLDGLAARGERVLSASDQEIGTVVPIYPKLKPRLLIVAAVLLVVGVVGVVEYYIGQQQWERVVGGKPEVAARIALGVVVMLGVLSWTCALTWFRRRPGVLRQHGTKMFIVGVVLLLIFATAMAYSFAGGIAAPTTGGVSGGSSANAATNTDHGDVEWIRWVIYLVMTALYGWTVVVAHLWHATAEDRRRVETHLPIRLAADRASVTDRTGLLRLRAALLRAISDAWRQGVDRATAITTAYYAGVRSSLNPSLLATWDHDVVSKPTFQEPEWLRRLDRAAADLDNSARQIGPESAPGATTSPTEITYTGGRG